MAALTAARKTPAKSGHLRQPPVKGGVKIWQGGLVAIDATGFAVPAAAVAAHKVIGRAEESVDNSAGAGGDQRVQTQSGIFRFENSASADLIGLKDIGSPAYVVDDQTVALTSNSAARPVAGIIYDVDADGVWIKV